MSSESVRLPPTARSLTTLAAVFAARSGERCRVPAGRRTSGSIAVAAIVAGLCTATAVIAQVESSTDPAVADDAAETIFVKGGATLNGATLERGMAVATGDTIVTAEDGFASIEFLPDSLVNIQPDSHATVARFLCREAKVRCLVEIDMRRGEFRSNVHTRDGGTVEFVISTPFATAAARGTAFDTLAGEGEFRVAVIEGEVDVEAEGSVREIDGGFGVVVLEGEPPGDPSALLPAPAFRFVPTRAAPGDTFGWFALEDAVSYRALLTLDGGDDDVRVETLRRFSHTGDETSHEITPAVEAGEYYVTLRAIGPDGLPGLQRTTPIEIVSLDEGVAPVAVELGREGPAFRIDIVDPPEGVLGFEIQTSRTPDFVAPLSIDATETAAVVLRTDAATLYARARVLVDAGSVSAFGPVASSR